MAKYTLLFSMKKDGKVNDAFSGDGTVLYGPNETNLSEGQKIIIDAKGRLLIAGTENSGSPKVYISRFFSSGQLDTTFGNNGVTIIDYSFLDNEQLSDMVLDAQGNITISISTKLNNFLALARLKPDGQPDPDFGSSGKGILFATGITESDTDVKHLIRGKNELIYEAHQETVPGRFSIRAFEFVQGKFKPAVNFGTNGSIQIDMLSMLPVAVEHKDRGATIVSLSFQHNENRILICGQLDYRIKRQTMFADGHTAVDEVFILAFDTTGKLDTSFGSGGIFRKEIDDQDPNVWFTQGLLLGQDGIVLDSSENIIFGSFYHGVNTSRRSITKLVMIKVSKDGKLTAYKTVPYSNPEGITLSMNSITIGPENEIYVSGSHPTGNGSLFFAKFNQDLNTLNIENSWHRVINIPQGIKETILDSAVDQNGNYFGIGEITTPEPIPQKQPILKTKLTLLQTIYAGDNIGEEWTIRISTNQFTMVMTRNRFKPGMLNENLVLYDEPANLEKIRNFGFEPLFISAFAQEHDWLFDDISNLVINELIKVNKPGQPVFRDISLHLVEHPLGIGNCSIILRLKAEMYFD